MATNEVSTYYSIQFKSPKIQPSSNTRTIYCEFSNYFYKLAKTEIPKLYLNYEERRGALFYKTLREIYDMQEAIKGHNIYSIEICDIHSNSVNNPAPPLNAPSDSSRGQIIVDLNKYLNNQGNNYFQMQRNKSRSKDISNIAYCNEHSNAASHALAANSSASTIVLTPSQLVNMLNIVAIDRPLAAPSTSASPTVAICSDGASTAAVASNVATTSTAATAATASTSGTATTAAEEEIALAVKTAYLQEYPVGKLSIEKMVTNADVMLQVIGTLSTSTFIGLTLTKACLDLEEILMKAPFDEELLNPSVGEMVLVILPDLRISRAFILELLGDLYRVAALECGEIVEVDAVFEVPVAVRNFDEFICVCEASEYFVSELSANDIIETELKDDNVLFAVAAEVNVKFARWVPDLTLRPSAAFVPNPENVKTLADLPPLELALNEMFSMIVSDVVDDATICFCPAQCNENLDLIGNILADADDLPCVVGVVPGQLCIGRCGSGWCRAVVLGVGWGEAHLRFIDFGDEYTVKMYAIKDMPDELLEFPASAGRATFTSDPPLGWETEDMVYKRFVAMATDKVGDLYKLDLIELIEFFGQAPV